MSVEITKTNNATELSEQELDTVAGGKIFLSPPDTKRLMALSRGPKQNFKPTSLQSLKSSNGAK